MLTDSESRVVGPLVVAFGTAFFVAGLARIIWPAADGTIYLASLGIGFGFPLFAAGLWSIRADMLRTGVDLEERRARLAPAPAATVAAPEPEAAPRAKDDEPIPAQIDRLERQRLQIVAHWHVYFRRLFAAMAAYGCDRDTLTNPKRPTKVTTQPGWNTATRIMAEAGILAKDNSGTRLLVSEADWNAGRLWERLPCPDSEPPEIDPPPYTTQQTTAETTINGVVRAD